MSALAYIKVPCVAPLSYKRSTDRHASSDSDLECEVRPDKLSLATRQAVDLSDCLCLFSLDGQEGCDDGDVLHYPVYMILCV